MSNQNSLCKNNDPSSSTEIERRLSHDHFEQAQDKITNEAILSAVQNRLPNIEDLATILCASDIESLRKTCRVLYLARLIDFDRLTNKFIPYHPVPFAILRIAERSPNLTCDEILRRTRTVHSNGQEWVQWLTTCGLLSVDKDGCYARPSSVS